MTYIRISIFFVTMWCFSVFSLAFEGNESIYFDSNLKNSILSSDNILNVEILYDLLGISEKDFIVRPVSSEGKVSIWNSENNIWIDSNDLWSTMPYLTPEIKLKINGLGNNPAYISFIIQNTKDFQLYFTSKQKVWSHQVYKNYLDKLNTNILNSDAIESTEEVLGDTIETTPAPSVTHPDQSLLSSAGLLIGIVLSLVAGFKMYKMLN